MFLNIQNIINLVEPHSMNAFLNITMCNSWGTYTDCCVSLTHFFSLMISVHVVYTCVGSWTCSLDLFCFLLCLRFTFSVFFFYSLRLWVAERMASITSLPHLEVVSSHYRIMPLSKLVIAYHPQNTEAHHHHHSCNSAWQSNQPGPVKSWFWRQSYPSTCRCGCCLGMN